MAEINWSDAQWETVNSAVTEAFGKASVAAAFLPCYGPLAASAETVRDLQIRGLQADLKVHDADTLKLFTLRVKVTLSSEQVADDSLSSAILTFRRAANILAQVEDEIVFNGFDARVTPHVTGSIGKALAASASPTDLPRVHRVSRAHEVIVQGSGPKEVKGLAAVPDTSTPAALAGGQIKLSQAHPGIAATGQAVVQEVAQAVAELEANSNPGPFACVLGSGIFVLAHTPEQNSMVLPADRITPMLGGPLLRSGSMDPNHGVVVSLGGEIVDIVVATPPRVQFLNLTGEAKYQFRVYERFVLRVKDQQLSPVFAFQLKGAGQSPKPKPAPPPTPAPSPTPARRPTPASPSTPAQSPAPGAAAMRVKPRANRI
jgi:uncharacterized linocin/CFP29 family protein